MTEQAKSLDEAIAESRAEFGATIDGRDYTRGELQDAFDRVADAEHWKAPVDATVEAAQDEVAVIGYAVMFFTGAWPTVRNVGGNRYHFAAPGYWNTIGA